MFTTSGNGGARGWCIPCAALAVGLAAIPQFAMLAVGRRCRNFLENAMPLDGAILGEGIYTPREAARLLGGTAQEVLRWTRGSGPRDPLWKSHYQFLDDTSEISFRDLMDLRVVRALRFAGISIQAVRYAIVLAKERFGIGHPLSTAHFKTDGVAILMDAVEKDGELVSLSRKHPGQKVFAKIVEQSVAGLDYEGAQVARWWPTRSKHVVIDPKRSFGDPVLDQYGISTRVIYQDFLNYSDQKYLAKLYEIGLPLVKDAIAYEDGLNVNLGRSSGQGLM